MWGQALRLATLSGHSSKQAIACPSFSFTSRHTHLTVRSAHGNITHAELLFYFFID
jgi:hypothetical protein